MPDVFDVLAFCRLRKRLFISGRPPNSAAPEAKRGRGRFSRPREDNPDQN
jgi:hypothetical protein